jgi:hypothetical protein
VVAIVPDIVTLFYGLSDRDRSFVAHVDRYRLSMIAALRKAVRPELSHNAATKIVQRLCAAGWLRRYPFRHPGCYFVLGAAGARALGRGRQRTFPLGPQALPTAYAVLLYAVLAKQPRCRLTAAEVQARCPWLPAPLTRAPHCTDVAGEILELVRVDLGGPAHHVAHKCQADLTARSRFREFAASLADGRFRLVVITAAPEKAAALRQALDRHSLPAGLAVHLSVIPALLSVLSRKHHAR